MTSMFCDCRDITTICLDNWNCNDQTVKLRMRDMFKSCKHLNSISMKRCTFACTSIDMIEMFSGCTELKHIDFTDSVFHNVENMGGMFELCNSLVQLRLPKIFPVINCNVIYMFSHSDNLLELDISKWNLQTIFTFISLFKNECRLLKSLRVIYLPLEYKPLNLTNADLREITRLEHVTIEYK